MLESSDLRKIILKLKDFIPLYVVIDVLLDYIDRYGGNESYCSSDIYEKIILQLIAIIEEQKKVG